MSEQKNLTENHDQEVAVRLPNPEHLILSTSPHIQDHDSISKIMGKVLLCLLPAILASLFYFGVYALSVYIWCGISAVLFE